MTTDDTHWLESQPLDQPITAEMLAQWEAEIDAFFAEIQPKLRALADVSVSEPTPDASPPRSTTLTNHPSTLSVDDVTDESSDRLQQVKRRLAERLEKSRALEQGQGRARGTDSRPFPLR